MIVGNDPIRTLSKSFKSGLENYKNVSLINMTFDGLFIVQFIDLIPNSSERAPEHWTIYSTIFRVFWVLILFVLSPEWFYGGLGNSSNCIDTIWQRIKDSTLIILALFTISDSKEICQVEKNTSKKYLVEIMDNKKA